MKPLANIPFNSIVLAGLVLSMAFFVSCDNPAQSDALAKITSTSSGCVSTDVLKTSTTSGVTESIFEYTFGPNVLNITFSITQYCGRKENSFIVTHAIDADTITVAVRDTIRGGPWCDCVYLVNTQITGLTGNRYLVRCRFTSPDRPDGWLFHEVEVHRP